MITPNATHQQTKRVVNPVWGVYRTVLTIDPSVNQSEIVGAYNCTVENARGSSSFTWAVGGNGKSGPEPAILDWYSHAV